MNFAKGLSNLLKPTYINLILAVCLIIILILIYLKTNKLDLFYGADATDATDATTTKPLISTLLTGNNNLTSFINNYISKMQQQNDYKKVLAKQEKTIQTLSQQVSNLINPST